MQMLYCCYFIGYLFAPDTIKAQHKKSTQLQFKSVEIAYISKTLEKCRKVNISSSRPVVQNLSPSWLSPIDDRRPTQAWTAYIALPGIPCCIGRVPSKVPCRELTQLKSKNTHVSETSEICISEYVLEY